MGEEREQMASGEREAARDDEVEGHALDVGTEREAKDPDDDVEGHMLDPEYLDSGNLRSE